MSRIPGTTNRQSSFLRAFLTSPSGPPPQDWPSPALLRKWLRRPSFCRAAHSLLTSLRFQADFQLSAAASAAIGALAHSAASPPQSDTPAPDLTALYRLLRLAHLRQRFTPTTPLSSSPGTPGESKGGGAASDEPDAAFTPPPLRRIGEPRPAPRLDYIPDLNPRQLELIAQKHGLKNLRTMPKEEFLHIALINGYFPPLENAPCFPDPSVPPASPAERFYYELIKSPSALLWYLKLYTEQTGDTRYKNILEQARLSIPHEQPWQSFPRFTAPPSPLPP